MPYPIRYARTADGVNVAYLDLGSGEPLIYLPSLPWANAAMMLERPLVSRHPEELATVLRLLPYDPRGCGLSDHDAEDLTLDGFVRDIDAVADAAGLECFALYGSADGSRVAIRYAAERPERVSKLVLWVPSVSPERLWDDPVMAVLRSLRRQDWETYLRTVAHAVVGGWDAERAPYAAAFAEVMAGSMRPDEFPRFARAMREHDVQADLGRVQAPTLVLTRDQVALYSLPVVREVAAGIPGARLVVSPGNWLLPCTDDAVTREIASFMGAEQPAPVGHLGCLGRCAVSLRRGPHRRRIRALRARGRGAGAGRRGHDERPDCGSARGRPGDRLAPRAQHPDQTRDEPSRRGGRVCRNEGSHAGTRARGAVLKASTTRRARGCAVDASQTLGISRSRRTARPARVAR
jgi:pimeloyl-ACP methyl ester carboxylesterase